MCSKRCRFVFVSLRNTGFGVVVQPPPRRFGVAFTSLRNNITILTYRTSFTFSARTTAHDSLVMSLPEKEAMVADQERKKEVVMPAEQA